LQSDVLQDLGDTHLRGNDARLFSLSTKY